MYHTSHILKGLKWVEEFLHVDPDWLLFGTGPAMVEAFKEGRIDIGYIGLPPAMIGIAKGLPLKCIAGGHVEGTVMIAREGFTKAASRDDVGSILKQFEGRKVGAPAHGSIHDVIIRFLIKKHNIRQVEVVNYPWADLIPEAMQEGVIDGAVGTPPLAVLARTWYCSTLIIPPAYLWPFNPSYGIVVKGDMLTQEALLEGFLKLHEKACNLITQKPGYAAQAIAREVKVVDQIFVMNIFSVSPRYCASLPQEYIDATLAFVPALNEMGYMRHDLTVDDIFEQSFIKKVHPESHHYYSPLCIGS